MKIPVEIRSLKDGIPKKGVWYIHFGTIFISVLRGSKPHLRRKYNPKDGKVDNDLSEWHRVWQYDIIEDKYGADVYGQKSYEITINVNNEKHRIDSVVENLAIEFQHTLGVDLEEMNARYDAHLAFGFTPYLVIDLTKFTFLDYRNSVRFENALRIKLNKWVTSKYALKNNLFLDLEDGMVRLVTNVQGLTQEMEKEYFIDNLLLLEQDLKNKITVVVLKEKRKSIIELRRIRSELVQEQREAQKETEAKKLLLENRRTEELNKYNALKNRSNDFSLYRKCLSNPILKPSIALYDTDIFNYLVSTRFEGPLEVEEHIYRSRNSDVVLTICTFSEILREDIPDSTGYKKKKIRNYRYSIIKISKGSSVLSEFEWRRGEDPKLLNNNQTSLF